MSHSANKTDEELDAIWSDAMNAKCAAYSWVDETPCPECMKRARRAIFEAGKTCRIANYDKAIREANKGLMQQAKRHGRELGVLWRLREEALADYEVIQKVVKIFGQVLSRKFKAEHAESIFKGATLEARQDFIEFLCAGMVGLLEDPDGTGKPAKNYVQADLDYHGQKLNLIVQRVEGKTPIEINIELQAENDDLRRMLLDREQPKGEP